MKNDRQPVLSVSCVLPRRVSIVFDKGRAPTVRVSYKEIAGSTLGEDGVKGLYSKRQVQHGGRSAGSGSTHVSILEPSVIEGKVGCNKKQSSPVTLPVSPCLTFTEVNSREGVKQTENDKMMTSHGVAQCHHFLPWAEQLSGGHGEHWPVPEQCREDPLYYPKMLQMLESLRVIISINLQFIQMKVKASDMEAGMVIMDKMQQDLNWTNSIKSNLPLLKGKFSQDNFDPLETGCLSKLLLALKYYWFFLIFFNKDRVGDFYDDCCSHWMMFVSCMDSEKKLVNTLFIPLITELCRSICFSRKAKKREESPLGFLDTFLKLKKIIFFIADRCLPVSFTLHQKLKECWRLNSNAVLQYFYPGLPLSGECSNNVERFVFVWNTLPTYSPLPLPRLGLFTEPTLKKEDSWDDDTLQEWLRFCDR